MTLLHQLQPSLYHYISSSLHSYHLFFTPIIFSSLNFPSALFPLPSTLREFGSMDLFTYHTLMMGHTKLLRHQKVLSLYNEALESSARVSKGTVENIRHSHFSRRIDLVIIWIFFNYIFRLFRFHIPLKFYSTYFSFFWCIILFLLICSSMVVSTR